MDKDDNYYIRLFGDRVYDTGEKVPVFLPLAYCSQTYCQCRLGTYDRAKDKFEVPPFDPEAQGFCDIFELDDFNKWLDSRRGQDENTGYV